MPVMENGGVRMEVNSADVGFYKQAGWTLVVEDKSVAEPPEKAPGKAPEKKTSPSK